MTHLDSIGVGEILLHNVDKDGSLQGMNECILNELNRLQLAPVLLAGGAGSSVHVTSILSSDSIQGIVAGSILL